jgi:hypothetical protein
MTKKLIIISLFIIGCSLISPLYAAGSAAKKEEPKYKLELTNVGVTPVGATQPRILESVSSGKGGQKYKLEIYKIEMVSPVQETKPVKKAPVKAPVKKQGVR